MKSDEYRQQERTAIAQVARDVETFVRMFYESQINQQAFMTEAYRLLQAQALDVENIRGQAFAGEMILQKLDEVMARINSMPELLRAEPGIIGWPGGFGGTSPVLPPSIQGTPGPAKHGEPGAGGFSGGYMPETGGMLSGLGGMSGSVPGAGMPGGMGGMSGSVPGAGMPGGMGGMSGSIPGAGMPGGMGGMSGSVPGAGMPSGMGGMSGSVPGAGMPSGMGGMSGSVPGAGMPSGMGGMSGSVPGGAGMPSGMGGMSPTMPGTSHTMPSHTMPGTSHTMPSHTMPGTSHTMPGTSHTMPSHTMPGTSYTIPGTSYTLPGTSQSVPTPTPGQESVPVPLGDQGPEAVPVVKPVATKQAEVRFLHASPDAPAVDLYVDHRKVAANVSYHTLTHYMPIETGRHRVQAFPHGVSVGALVDHTVDFKPGRHYTIAVGGELKEIRPIVIEDDLTGTKPGFARLKIVHLAPNAPAVDITLPSGKVLIGHLTFKEKSPSIQVAPGTRELDVRLAGKQDVVLKVPKIKFEPNASYTLYITGLLGREPGLHPLVVREHQ